MGCRKLPWFWLAAIGCLLCFPRPSNAEPSATQIEHHLSLQQDGDKLVLEYGAVVGELLQQAVWSEIDRNGNDLLEADEQRAYAEKLTAALILRVNEAPIRWEPATFQYPLAAEALCRSLTTFRIRLTAPLPRSVDYTLTLQNETFPQFPSAPAVVTPGTGFTVASLCPDGRRFRAHLRPSTLPGEPPDQPSAPSTNPPAQPGPGPTVDPLPPEPATRLEPEKLFPRSGFALAVPADEPPPTPGPGLLALLLLAALTGGVVRGRQENRSGMLHYAAGILGGWLILQGMLRLVETSGLHGTAQITLAAGVFSGLCGIQVLRRLMQHEAPLRFPWWPEAGVLALSLGTGAPAISLVAVLGYLAVLFFQTPLPELHPSSTPRKGAFPTVLLTALLLAGGIWLAWWGLTTWNSHT